MEAEKWLRPENLKKVTNWAKKENLSIAQIAKKMRISARTFYRWLDKYEEFREAFNEGRETVDGTVETSFIKMCIGFKETVTKPQKIKRVVYEDGKKVEEYEEFIDVQEEVYIKPDVTAQKFYLCNRMPDRYRPENATLPPAGDDENYTGVVALPNAEDIEEAEIIEAEITEGDESNAV